MDKSEPCSVLRPLVREFHTYANRIAFNAESVSLGLSVYPDYHTIVAIDEYKTGAE